jgi:flagellar biosynthesis/type III secretory pathway M-ring protein FliF/YscJ
MEMIFAAGPAFGWWCRSNEAWAMWIAMPWAISGIVAMVVSRFVLNQYRKREVLVEMSKRTDVDEYDGETNPMIRALNTYESVDRSFDFGVVEKGERLAESRRNRISASAS